jgi:hypothetical protein
LCGTEVISWIEIISNPAPSIARIAVSRPEPCPFTKISTFFIPVLRASNAAFSAAVCAAKGVLFRAPLNPELPAEAQEIVSPFKFVIVTIVLLNVDWI